MNPVLRGTIQAIHAGGANAQWAKDRHGEPHYRYEKQDGRITIFFERAPDASVTIAALWQAVQDLSVETADVFLILMARIAKLADPRRDLAKIRLEEIARYRGVRVRRGSTQTLHEDFKRQVRRLADLRLTMSWPDYQGSGSITFGKERPDRLLDIVDVEYKYDGATWTAFSYRCGQALAHFHNPEGIRWVGYYSTALLGLSPSHEAFTKKVGAYWILTGTASELKGEARHATPHSILTFCGERPDCRNPGRTVEKLILAHKRLREIGVLAEVSDIEPPNRQRGFLSSWLERPVAVRLSNGLWELGRAEENAMLPPAGRRRVSKSSQMPLIQFIPSDPKEIVADALFIRQFRVQNRITQVALARDLGIARVTLSRYEGAARKLPLDLAQRILTLWRQRAL